MKVAIGYEIQKGPWGGGNAFAKSLSDYLKLRGIKVVSNLNDKDIDIILLTDPRSFNDGITFGPLQILKYILLNKKTLVASSKDQAGVALEEILYIYNK